jgi:hypothetical protein
MKILKVSDLCYMVCCFRHSNLFESSGLYYHKDNRILKSYCSYFKVKVNSLPFYNHLGNAIKKLSKCPRIIFQNTIGSEEGEITVDIYRAFEVQNAI